MPCYDSRSDSAEGLLERAASAIRSEEREALERAKEKWTHNSPVASHLCEAMKVLEGAGLAHGPVISKELYFWWRDHQRRDAEGNVIYKPLEQALAASFKYGESK